MTRLVLVRHGETVWNAEQRCQGFSDPELSERGREQAAALARCLAATPIDAVYASPLRRALETARAIAAPHGLEVQTEPDLRELNQGDCEGLTAQELRTRYADLLTRWRAAPAFVRLPGGECLAELAERARRAVEPIVDRHRDQTIVIVSHNFTILTLLCWLTGTELDEFRRHQQDVAALTVIELSDDGAVALVKLNDTAHLAVIPPMLADAPSRRAGVASDTREAG